jgi:hypothetical protein
LQIYRLTEDLKHAASGIIKRCTDGADGAADGAQVDMAWAHKSAQELLRQADNLLVTNGIRLATRLPRHALLEEIRAMRPQHSIGKVNRRRSVRNLDC